MKSVHDLEKRIAELEECILTLRDKLNSKRGEVRTIVKRVEVPVEKVVTKRVEVPVERVVTKRVEVPVERIVMVSDPEKERQILLMREKIVRYEQEIRRMSKERSEKK